jgi:hypothetical protein
LQWGLSHESAVLAFCGGFGDFHADIDNGEAIQEETAIVVECRLVVNSSTASCAAVSMTGTSYSAGRSRKEESTGGSVRIR